MSEREREKEEKRREEGEDVDYALDVPGPGCTMREGEWTKPPLPFSLQLPYNLHFSHSHLLTYAASRISHPYTRCVVSLTLGMTAAATQTHMPALLPIAQHLSRRLTVIVSHLSLKTTAIVLLCYLRHRLI